MTNTPDDVEVIEKRADFQGYFRIDTYRLRHRLHDGRWSKEVTREVFERGHAVAVIPYDPALDRVVLIEQFRIGAYAARQSRWFADDVSPWLIEVIAGIIEPGEDPAEVAVRETVEECGLNLSELIPVSHYLASPGGTSESVFLFCGRVDASDVGGLHGIADEGEDIRPFTLPFSDALDWLNAGRIANAASIIALQWLALNRDAVRKKWR
ncbi:MAG: NUDIX domain-containing protein [Proteobacteria bacterium]|nr:NUDIX domain-containing protein [Pseudomonadota bacterium]